uniref:Vpu protein n=1 Tax=Human immunodeficiency virus type 1 TaxID=11676 RepID=Q8UT83_HV1|nr:vpu protein [Human immunodeficiency virus 1]
MVDWTKKSRL